MLAKGERYVIANTPAGKRLVIIPSPEEDAAINAAIASDPGAVELTDEEFEGLRPASAGHHRVEPRRASASRPRVSRRAGVAPPATHAARPPYRS